MKTSVIRNMAHRLRADDDSVIRREPVVAEALIRYEDEPWRTMGRNTVRFHRTEPHRWEAMSRLVFPIEHTGLVTHAKLIIWSLDAERVALNPDLLTWPTKFEQGSRLIIDNVRLTVNYGNDWVRSPWSRA